MVRQCGRRDVVHRAHGQAVNKMTNRMLLLYAVLLALADGVATLWLRGGLRRALPLLF